MKYNGPFVRQPGMYDVNAACEECSVADFGPSLTQQSQAEEADINTIVKRFGLTGKLPENVRAPQYADFDQVYDYKTAMDAIAGAQTSFNQMPAAIRARFDNDPGQFVDFCSDPANLGQLREMGLAPPQTAQGSPTGTGGVQPTPPGEPPSVPQGTGQTPKP